MERKGMKDQRKKQGEKTRKRILAAAQVLIEKVGIDKLTTRGIAAQAGVSQSSLYHHFSGVDEVLMFSMKEQVEKKLEIFQQARCNTASEYLRAAFDFSVKQVMDKQGEGYIAILERVQRDESFRKQVQEFKKSMIQQMRVDLQSYFQKPLEPQGLERVLLGFSLLREGMINQRRFYGAHSPFMNAEQGAKEILTLLVGQLIEQET